MNLNIHTDTSLSPLKNPFKIKCVEGISVHYTKGWEGKGYWWGRVTFKNGSTSGRQDFEVRDAETGLKIILDQIDNFIKTL